MAGPSQAPESESHLDISEKMDHSKTTTTFTLPDLKDEDEVKGDKPVIIRALQREIKMEKDAQSLSMDFEFSPRNDSKLQLSWYHNGLPLSMGSRIQMKTEFGTARLVITDLSDRDQGVYTCRLSNQFGEATTFAMVECSGKSSIDMATKHPRGTKGLDAVTKIESKDASIKDDLDSEIEHAPEFASEFQALNATEGERAFNEAILKPKLDSSMKIEWFKDDRQLDQSECVAYIFTNSTTNKAYF